MQIMEFFRSDEFLNCNKTSKEKYEFIIRVGLNLVLLDKVLKEGISGYGDFSMLEYDTKGLSLRDLNIKILIEQHSILDYDCLGR